MPVVAHQSQGPAAIRTDLGAIFRLGCLLQCHRDKDPPISLDKLISELPKVSGPLVSAHDSVPCRHD